MVIWLRGQESNLRPSAYETDELPLLHPRMKLDKEKPASAFAGRVNFGDNNGLRGI